MSGLVQEITTYKLGQELPDFESWPAALATLENAAEFEPFVVKVDQQDGPPKHIVAIIGALMMDKPGKLDHALMIIGHNEVIDVDPEDIFVVTAHLGYPDDYQGEKPFDVEATMDHYWGRPQN